MYLIAIGWMYVVLMMSVAEAASPSGSLLGAVITFVLYGVLPLSIVIYILGTPARRRARLTRQAEEDAASAASAASDQPDAGSQAAAGVAGGRTAAPADPAVRKEP